MTSQAARVSVPAGPAPPCALMPNRLLPMRASRLRPQSDSRMAWATVTLAGTPVVRCELCAAVPTAVMKSLSEANAYVWGARTNIGARDPGQARLACRAIAEKLHLQANGVDERAVDETQLGPLRQVG